MKSFIRLSIGILHSAFVFIGLILYYMVETEVNIFVTGDIFCCFNPYSESALFPSRVIFVFMLSGILLDRIHLPAII